MRKLIAYGAVWCDPCKRMAPVIDRVFSDSDFQSWYSGIERVDVDADPVRAAKAGVNALPTYVIVDEGGNEIKRHVGVWNGPYIEQKLREWLTS